MAAVVMTSTPKVANSSPKRVSFGEGGSLVETLIIDDDMPAAERQYYEDALMKKSASTSSSNFSGSSLSNSVLRKNTESHDNPFLADGELSKKADYIISHSRISRSEVKIVDPDNVSKEPPVVIEMVEKTESAPVVASEPPKSRENGQVEEVAPEAVQLEVANASQPQPETATQVKPKDKPKCQCCVVM